MGHFKYVIQKGTGNGTQAGGCDNNLKGDGECSDQNNNAECEYDGGDCLSGGDSRNTVYIF